jgi:hypothetical protein
MASSSLQGLSSLSSPFHPDEFFTKNHKESRGFFLQNVLVGET